MSLCVQFPEVVEIENAIRYGYSWYDIVEREFENISYKEIVNSLNTPACFVEPPTEAECAARRLNASRKFYTSIRESALDAIRACSVQDRTVDIVSTFLAEFCRIFPTELQQEILVDLVTVIEAEDLLAPTSVPAPTDPVLYEVPPPEIKCVASRFVSTPVVCYTPSPITASAAETPSVAVSAAAMATHVAYTLYNRLSRAILLQETLCLQSANPFDWVVSNTVHPACLAVV
jgi:hypothetical protein